MAKEFKWDPKALEPNQHTITLGGEEITLYEFPKKEFLQFVADLNETPEFTDVATDDGVERTKRPFKEIAADQEKLICKYLSIATRSAKKPKFFEELDLTASAFGVLTELLMDLNSFDEIVATGGNWLLLPLAKRVKQAEVEAEANES